MAPSPQELQPLPEQTLAAVTQQVDWLNSLVSPTVIPRKHFDAMPRMLQAWVRNCIFSVLVYFGLNFAWAYYIYECFGPNLFPKHNMPSWKDMGEQMWVAFWSLPVYAMLPTLTEEVVERGWTLTYARVSDIGVPLYVALFVLYMCFVEFGVYWMHRGLHDIHSGYRCAPAPVPPHISLPRSRSLQKLLSRQLHRITCQCCLSSLQAAAGLTTQTGSQWTWLPDDACRCLSQVRIVLSVNAVMV